MINLVHVGVKILNEHERSGDRDITQWLPSPTMNDKGKVGVGKVRQNDLAFRMNALSREVLRKCLTGIIIMESNIRRWRIKRRRSTKTKMVPSWSEFTFRCHRHDSHKQKERERKKRQSEKSQAASNISIILKRKYICMGNAWTCDMQNKLHHGLSPIQTYHHTNR